MSDFYRVEKSGNGNGGCQCERCEMWTVVFNDGELTEIGTSWQGVEGREAADDVCDLMNMAFDAGRASRSERGEQ